MKNLEKKLNKCNICGYPKYIKIKVFNEELNRMKEESHLVGCLGHIGIHPSMWNKHPDYDKYRKTLNQKRNNNLQKVTHVNKKTL